MHRVPATQFRLVDGADALKLYQFNTSTARHYFCNIAEFIHFIVRVSSLMHTRLM